MRTNFICSVNNEAVLKALFKIPDDELTFARAIEVAVEVEEAARCAKETIYGAPPTLHKVEKVKARQASDGDKAQEQREDRCSQCGSRNHSEEQCWVKSATCYSCGRGGHLARNCRAKRGSNATSKGTSGSTRVTTIRANQEPFPPPLQLPVEIQGKKVTLEVDTGAGDNFMSKSLWRQVGKPKLKNCSEPIVSATGDKVPLIGTCEVEVAPCKREHLCEATGEMGEKKIPFYVTTEERLNLLGLSGIDKMAISMDALVREQWTKDETGPNQKSQEKERQVPRAKENKAVHWIKKPPSSFSFKGKEKGVKTAPTPGAEQRQEGRASHERGLGRLANRAKRAQEQGQGAHKAKSEQHNKVQGSQDKVCYKLGKGPLQDKAGAKRDGTRESVQKTSGQRSKTEISRRGRHVYGTTVKTPPKKDPSPSQARLGKTSKTHLQAKGTGQPWRWRVYKQLGQGKDVAEGHRHQDRCCNRQGHWRQERQVRVRAARQAPQQAQERDRQFKRFSGKPQSWWGGVVAAAM
jgi:hypothetical protein